MNSLLRKAATFGILWIARNYQRVSLDLAKVQAVSMYVKTIRDVRLAVIGVVSLVLAIGLLVGSFLMLHLAIVAMLPVAFFWKAAILAAWMGAYFLILLTALLVALSEKMWMKKTGASEMVRKTASRILAGRRTV